jgi:hypothetical protein
VHKVDFAIVGDVIFTASLGDIAVLGSLVRDKPDDGPEFMLVIA